MKLFVAVVPPVQACQELAAATRPLHKVPGADDLRWTGPQGWHFTLAFIGEVDEGVVPDLETRLARAAHRHGPYTLRLRGGGRFGDRTLWAGADGDLTGLGRLAESVQAAAARAGAEPSRDHGFNAHLTLARGRGRTHLRPYAEALQDFEGSPWSVTSIALMRSNPPRSGIPGEQPRYETMGTWPLGG